MSRENFDAAGRAARLIVDRRSDLRRRNSRLIVVVAVAVVFAVGFVVLFVVADQVAQSESIVGGDEIDAGVRPPAVMLVEIGGSSKPVRHFADAPSRLSRNADRVAIFSVPFRPERGKVADLIAAFANIPWLCDQLHLREDRVLMNDVEECMQRVRHPADCAPVSAARSKRKPSTCISSTQYRRLSITSCSARGWTQIQACCRCPVKSCRTVDSPEFNR